MRYVVVLHKDRKSCYGVTVPDLPGCFSAGDTVDEAMTMAREAILGHLEVLVDQGMEIPPARPIEEHKNNGDYADAYLWGTVEVATDNLAGKAVRINISMQERVLAVVDQVAAATHVTRSGFLERAALRMIESQGRAAPIPSRSRKELKTKRAGRGRAR